jgi:outer membrane biosynthesis protein TonB
MLNFRMTTALFAAAIGIVAVAPKAGADEWNKMTYVTISGPVEVPGAVLPAGKYVFKLVDSQSDRHIVTVQNDRQNHTYTTFFAVPDYRVQPTGKTVFTYYETPAGQPKAIREWFYPGDNFGQEFVYHKKFTQVAQVTQQEQTPPPPPPAVEEKHEEQTEIAQNTPPPPPEAAPQAEPAPAPEQAPEAAPQTPAPAPQVIPQTATTMPLLALLGFGCLGLAAGIGVFARRLS